MKIAGRRPMTALRDGVRWSDRRLPRGIRSVVGLPLMVGGMFGFLPILGFWMLPMGAALIALDIPVLRRRLLDRLERAGGEQPADPGR